MEYAISKNKAVKYALSLHEKYNLPVVILRPFTVYGIGQPAKMFVSQAIECAVKGIPFEMSKGMQKRDLLFITDFVNAIMKALTVKNIEGEVFNVGSGRAIALKELAKKIWMMAEADERLLKIGARFTKENELHDTQADISKIKAILNWEPHISLDEGLMSMINKVRNELK
jgi:nucleoside-diphosphate-sugar epimerase